MSYLCVGCDPGVSGAVAVISEDRSVVLAEMLPTAQFGKSPKRKTDPSGAIRIIKGKRTELSFTAVAALFERIQAMPGEKYFFIEDVNSMPRDAATASFTFGGAFWALQQAAADRKWPIERIKAKVWQRSFISAAANRDRAAIRKAYLEAARRLFPAVDLSRVKDAERAAALLIAEHGRRTRFVTGAGETINA